MDLLSNNGIGCIILKGPAFAILAYGNLTQRQFVDLDILIHAGDFSTVYDLLCRSGYSPAFTLGPKQKKFEVRTENHFSFSRQGDLIEVHWDIAPHGYLYPIPPDQMWQGLTPIAVLDREVFTLSPENTLLFTCLHGAKHGWRQLKWIVDLAYLCRSFRDFDWPAFLNRARNQGFWRQVCLGLSLAEDLVGAAIPVNVVDQFRKDTSANHLAAEVKARLFEELKEPGLFADYGFYLRSRERWRDRIYNLFDMVFVPKQIDWLTLPLPEPFYPAYYLFRPFRLLAKFGWAAITAPH